MSYRVDIRPAAAKFLRNLRDKTLLARLVKTVRDLGENPHPSGSLKMRGGDDLYRVRVGDYRIIYQIQDAALIVLVVDIGHRREIYR